MTKKKKIHVRDLNNKKSSNGDLPSKMKFGNYIPAVVSFAMLISGMLLDNFNVLPFFKGWVRIVWYGLAYAPVGFPVIKEGWESIRRGDFFTEFFLMSIATLGAFAIGEYP